MREEIKQRRTRLEQQKQTNKPNSEQLRPYSIVFANGDAKEQNYLMDFKAISLNNSQFPLKIEKK